MKLALAMACLLILTCGCIAHKNKEVEWKILGPQIKFHSLPVYTNAPSERINPK